MKQRKRIPSPPKFMTQHSKLGTMNYEEDESYLDEIKKMYSSVKNVLSHDSGAILKRKLRKQAGLPPKSPSFTFNDMAVASTKKNKGVQKVSKVKDNRTVSGPGLAEGQNKGQDKILIKRTEKDKPTTAAIEKHANKLSGVTTAQASPAPKSQMRKKPKLDIKRRFKPSEVAGMNEGQTVSTGGPVVSTGHDDMKYTSKLKSPIVSTGHDSIKYTSKLPKPTSFDQKVSNFLGTTFKMHTWKEKNGQMVPDKSGVTAQPTGEGLDLFGGGKRRKKKAAGK